MTSNTTADSGLPTDNRTGVIIGIVAFLLPLTTAFVGLRFYARKYLSNSIWVDDWMTLVSLVRPACFFFPNNNDLTST
jgi:hypothetical protein